MMQYEVQEDFWHGRSGLQSTRAGFGEGLCQAGDNSKDVVALAADLTDSVQMGAFAKAFPDRFIQVGVAEQNLVTVASGMARAGKVPFTGSYAAFSPGRNWEQIRTTICLNDVPVKIIGSHAGLTVGPDGATHQMLEDIALMRSLPNMVVIAPGDAYEAKKATMAIALNGKPSYLRLARESSPLFTQRDAVFEIGKAYVLREGRDVTLLGTGLMTYQLLRVAMSLAEKNIQCEVVHVPTIKPLDSKTVLESVKKTGRAVTAEEGQVAAGFGGLIAELLSEDLPTPLKRFGVQDRFGESGQAIDLLDHFGLTAEKMAPVIANFVQRTPKYHQD
ncbi:transketolase family protein [Candidatus Saccharibacteria bacterium]|jgi:transketolase|nr:transketolase family protein [Candidatus Saccharibacteria bacterium]